MKSMFKWFFGRKWICDNVKGVKAVYYKKEVLAVRLNDAIPVNYGIAKKIFEGVFGNATYTCNELMLCYKTTDTRLDEHEYDKLCTSLHHLGFNLCFASKDNGTYVVGIVADQNVMNYVTDKSLRMNKFNVESINYIT